jgi:poly(3-hydroxyalkanoate) synthetase
MRDKEDIVDDIRTIYETIHEMLAHWTSEYHAAFISEMLKLNPLEQELQEITGDWDSMHQITIAIYKSIFPNARTYEPIRLE